MSALLDAENYDVITHLNREREGEGGIGMKKNLQNIEKFTKKNNNMFGLFMQIDAGLH